MINLDTYHNFRIKKTDDKAIHLEGIGQSLLDKNVVHWIIFYLKILASITILSIFKDSDFIYLILLGFLTYILFSAFSLFNKEQKPKNHIKHIVIDSKGITITNSNKKSKIYTIKKIDSLLIEYVDEKHIKLTINKDTENRLLLFISNIFIRPSINDEIAKLLSLDILGKRKLYGESTTILIRSETVKQPKLYKIKQMDDVIIIDLPMHRVTLDHKNRNITTKATLGTKRYISFDSIRDFKLSDLSISIVDNDGFDFILYEMDAKQVTNENYIYYQRDLENIIKIIDLDIKLKIVESLETLELNPLSEKQK